MPNMMHLSGINLAFKVLKLLIDSRIIMLMDLRNKILAQGQNSSSPKSINLTSSETSSPTSKSGSILRASVSDISSFGSSTSPSSTTIRFLHISKSPLSGLIIISKLSSEPNFLLRAASENFFQNCH